MRRETTSSNSLALKPTNLHHHHLQKILMHSPQQHKSSLLKTCKLSLALVIILLPSLIASLIFFILFSLFLFFPISCLLIATFFLPKIVSGVRIGYVIKLLIKIGASTFNKWMPYGDVLEGVPECIDFETFEVPSFGESEEEEEEEEEEVHKVFAENSKEGMISQDLLDFETFGPTRSGEYRSFYEILSYWRRKEKVACMKQQN